MEVRCEHCDAPNVVDDALAIEGSIARCAACWRLFRVTRGRSDIVTTRARATGFIVRRAAGDGFTVKDVATLQRCVVEGRVGREDEVSAAGEPFKRLGDIPELEPFFAVIDRVRAGGDALPPPPEARRPEPARAARGGKAGEETPALSGPSAPVGMNEEPRRGEVEPIHSETWELPKGPAAPEPAWTRGAAPPAAGPREDLGRRHRAERDGGSRLVLVAGVVLVVAVAGAAVVALRPAWVGLGPDTSPTRLSFGPGSDAGVATADSSAATPEPAPSPEPTPAAPDRHAPGRAAGPGAGRGPESASGGAPAAGPAAAVPRAGEVASTPPSPPAAPERPAAARPASPEPVAPEPGGASPAGSEPAAGRAGAAPAVPGSAAPRRAPSPETTDRAEPAEPARPARPEPAPKRVAAEAARPRGPKAILAEARRLRERGKPDAALDLYTQLVAENPNDAAALAGRGLCYLDMSQYRTAEASFSAALEADPALGDALLGLAETYRYEGRRAEAVEYYGKYLAAHPDGEAAVAARNAIEALKE